MPSSRMSLYCIVLSCPLLSCLVMRNWVLGRMLDCCCRSFWRGWIRLQEGAACMHLTHSLFPSSHFSSRLCFSSLSRFPSLPAKSGSASQWSPCLFALYCAGMSVCCEQSKPRDCAEGFITLSQDANSCFSLSLPCKMIAPSFSCVCLLTIKASVCSAGQIARIVVFSLSCVSFF